MNVVNIYKNIFHFEFNIKTVIHLLQYYTKKMLRVKKNNINKRKPY